MDLWQNLSRFQGATFSLEVFLINLALTAVFSLILEWFYVRYAVALSNRKRFAGNFLPLALTTMLIITVVKSSLALSLGLVGALSIIRFRAAIKDPQELTYLFIAIAIGVAAGAEQTLILLIGFVFLLASLTAYKFISGTKKTTYKPGSYMLQIQSKLKSKAIEQTLSTISEFSLKRYTSESGTQLFTYELPNVETDTLEEIEDKLLKADPDMALSVIETPEIFI